MNREQIHSHAMSILKCEYGWNGCSPGKTPEDWARFEDMTQRLVAKEMCAGVIADKLAIEIHRVVGNAYFRQRRDGKPNTRIISEVAA